MYRSDEMEVFPEQIEKIFSAMEIEIMQSIIEKVKENDEITRSADWQAYRLYQMGKSSGAIKNEMQNALAMTDAEIERLYSHVLKEGYARDEELYKATGKQFIPYEENESLQQLIKAVKEQTNNELTNITGTTGFAVKNTSGKKEFLSTDRYLQKVLDEATMHVLNGTYDYSSIIRKVVNEMTTSGVRSIDYESGRSNRIEVAARRAVVTGLNQVTAKITEDNMQKLDTEFVEVSWHSTARPSHQEWQGRVFYWNKGDENAEITVDGVLYKSFIKETGYGTVDGLCGANCRHTTYSFIPGVSVRTYTDEQLDKMNAEENEKKLYNGKEYTKYEATQYQRRLERVMRKQRQDIKLLKDAGYTDEDDEVINARCRYQGTSVKYRDFSKAMGLREHRDRVNVDGLRDIGQGKFTKESKAEQSYKPVEIDANNTLETNRGKIEIVANKIENASNNIYVSSNVKLKPKQLHTIDSSITKTLKRLDIIDADNLPKVLIINNAEMQTGALASYHSVKNVMYLDESIGNKKRLLELQKDAACPKNELSTYVHEYIHWRDAQSYRAGYGQITDSAEYLNWIRKKSKKAIDNLINKGYNVVKVSEYASDEYDKGKYDETYTEYRVKQLLGE